MTFKTIFAICGLLIVSPAIVAMATKPSITQPISETEQLIAKLNDFSRRSYSNDSPQE
jgi:hypothetical protein